MLIAWTYNRSLAALMGPAASMVTASCSLLFDPSMQAGSDAGLPDAEESPADAAPISFALLPPRCGETKIQPTQVQTSSSQEILRYRWVLMDSDGVKRGEVYDDPGAALRRSQFAFDGTIAEPTFNLTPYREERVAKFERASGTTVPSMFVSSIPLSEGEYEFEMTASMPDGAFITVLLRQPGTGGENYAPSVQFSCDVSPCPPTYFREVVSTNSNLSDSVSNAMLQLVFYGAGTFFVDGVRLRKVGDTTDLIANSSFEDATEWSVGNAPAGELTFETIPDGWTAYGDYTLRLSWIDMSGFESVPHQETITHEPCP